MYTITIAHKTGKVSYPIYTKNEAKAEGLEYVYWKEAEEGQWAVSDDDYVAKVIKKKIYPSNIPNRENIYLRFPWGYHFFNPKYKTKKLQVEGRKTPHTLAGKPRMQVQMGTVPWKNMAMAYAYLMDFDLAIDMACGSVSASQRRRYKRTMRTEEFRSMVREELQKLLQDHGKTEKFSLDLMDEALEIARDKKDVRAILSVMENIQEMHGMKDRMKQKTTTQIEAHQTTRLLEEIEEEERKLVATQVVEKEVNEQDLQKISDERAEGSEEA